jgi:uncharacterized LabA/DUF88 family protein
VLFVDFDNMMGYLSKDFLDRMPNWLAWLEDGQFDASMRKRKFVEKRVYWNTPFEVYREAVETQEFKVFHCPSRVRGKKSAADMTIALDAVEAVQAPGIEECVLLTLDTDFEPLLQKLGDRSRQSVILADPRNVSMEVFLDSSDFVISLEHFRTAMAYERKRHFLENVKARLAVWRQAWLPKDHLDLAAAAGHIAELGKCQPGQPLGRKMVIERLKQKIPSFKTTGPQAYFDYGNYETMLERVAAKNDAFFLHEYDSGGRAVSWRGNESSASPPGGTSARSFMSLGSAKGTMASSQATRVASE